MFLVSPRLSLFAYTISSFRNNNNNNNNNRLRKNTNNETASSLGMQNLSAKTAKIANNNNNNNSNKRYARESVLAVIQCTIHSDKYSRMFSNSKF